MSNESIEFAVEETFELGARRYLLLGRMVIGPGLVGPGAAQLFANDGQIASIHITGERMPGPGSVGRRCLEVELAQPISLPNPTTEKVVVRR
jgi:hypothetical protein